MDTRFPNGLSAKLASGVRVNNDRAKGAAALARGPNRGRKLISAPWSETWPATGSTLDLDFANNRGFVRGVGQGGAMDAVTFTRASTGNYVGNDGLLSYYQTNPNNLCSFSENYNNSAWSYTNAYATNAIYPDPLGGNSAGNLVPTNVTGNHMAVCFSNTSISTGVTYTFSIYVKSNGATVVGFRDGGFGVGWITFNLISGTVVGSTAFSGDIINVGNGWYRIWYRLSNPYTGVVNTQIGVAPDGFTGSTYSASFNDPSKQLFIFGAQYELASSPSTYMPNQSNINQPRFDWASTAQVANKNLLTNTENIVAGQGWVARAYTTTVNATTAPDGTQSADLIIPTTTSSDHFPYQVITVISGQQYTESVYMKAGGYNYGYLKIQPGSSTPCYGIIVDLTNGNAAQVVATGGATGSYTITDVGSGWYRVSVTVTMTSSSYQFTISAVPSVPATLTSFGDATFAGNGTSGVYFWGAQLEAGSSVTSYQSIGSQLPTNTPLTANSTCNGLLVEESRANRILWCRDASQTPNRNLIAYSEEFNASYWAKLGISVTADATTDPNGGNTADLIYPQTTGTNRWVYKSGLPTTNTYTKSIYAKASGLNFLCFYKEDGGGAGAAWFNLSTGTVGTVASGYTASITFAGNNWYRCTITSVVNNQFFVFGGVDADNSITATASGTNGIYVWGAQLDYGSTATTYEKTTLSGAIWVKQNCIASKIATGIDGVANAATQITASATNAVLIQPISLASGSRTGSVYLKRITGTGNIQVSLDGSTWSTVDLSSTEWRRIVLSGTVTNPVVGILLATNGDEVAMDYAQVEDGALATSPILTTTASVTRASDTATLFSAPLFANTRNGGTLFCEATYSATPSGNGFVVISDNNAGNRVLLGRANFAGPNSFDAYVITNNIANVGHSVLPASVKSNQTIEIGNKWKLAVSYSRNSLIFGFNGFVTSSYSLSASGYNVPNNVDRLNIGTNNAGGSATMAGWISKIIYTPVSVTRDGIVEMTN